MEREDAAVATRRASSRRCVSLRRDADDRLVQVHARRSTRGYARVAEREDPAVARDQPVAVALRRGRDPDDRLVQVLPSRRPEVRGAEVVDVAVGRREPVAAGRMVDRDADDRRRRTAAGLGAVEVGAPPKLKTPPSAAAGAVPTRVRHRGTRRAVRRAGTDRDRTPTRLTVPSPAARRPLPSLRSPPGARSPLRPELDRRPFEAEAVHRHACARRAAARCQRSDLRAREPARDGPPNPVERSKPLAALNLPPVRARQVVVAGRLDRDRAARSRDPS